MSKEKKCRPADAKCGERVSVTSLPVRCPSCGSTNRAPYRDGPVATHEFAGEIDGRPYNQVVWRNTHCLNCGQRIRVREYLFDPAIESAAAALVAEQRAKNEAAMKEAEKETAMKEAKKEAPDNPV